MPGAPLGGWRDPLVNPPAGGIEGWFSTITSTVRRSLRTVVIIALLGFSLPQALFAMVATYLRQVGLFQDGAGQLDGALADVVSGVGIGLVLLVLVLALAAAVMSFASLAAIVWAVTQEAATGQPVPVDQAFRYGLRRVLPIIGWTFVAGLLVLVGLILCVLPGLYVAFGVSLTAYVVIFERGSGPIGQSFKLTHDHFGPALGRVLLSWLPFVLYSIVSEVFFGLIGVGIRAAGTQTVGDGLSLGASLALNCVEAVLAGLVGALAVICMFVTYADLRARQQPLSTPVLQAAL